MHGQELRKKLVLIECEGKSVLDLGCAAHSSGFRLHDEICKVAKRCVGLDVDKRRVEQMVKEGFEVYHADAEDFEVGKYFEVVVLGELPEHLSNIGRVLDGARKHLVHRGKMVITTPNPFNPSVFIQYELRDSGNHSHVAYYSPVMFRRLAIRHGFVEKKIVWIQKNLSEPRTLRGKFFVLLGRFLIPKRFSAESWFGVYENGL